MFNIFFFENRVFYEIMSKNIEEPDRPQIILRSMHIACWKPMATNTHTGCVILIDFSNTAMVALTRLNVMLYVVCLYCWLLDIKAN